MPQFDHRTPSFLDDPVASKPKPRKQRQATEPEKLEAEVAVIADYESFVNNPFWIEMVMLADEAVASIENRLLNHALQERKRIELNAHRKFWKDIKHGRICRNALSRAISRLRARDEFSRERKSLLAEAQTRLDSVGDQE